MPTYEFYCDHCDQGREITQSIKDALPEICWECGQTTPDFHQVYGNVTLIVYGSPTTIGQQAEANAKHVGKAKLEEMAEKKSLVSKRKLPKGATRNRTGSNELPWFRSGEVPGLPKRVKPLDKRTIKDPKKFIETGKE